MYGLCNAYIEMVDALYRDGVCLISRWWVPYIEMVGALYQE